MNLYGFTLALTAVLFVFEFQNLLSRRRGLILELADEGCDDFTILVPVYGHPSYFKNGENLSQWREHVLLVLEISTAEMREFADEAERDGWRVFRTVLPTPLAVPRLIAAALPVVTTTWVVRVDADTLIADDVPRRSRPCDATAPSSARSSAGSSIPRASPRSSSRPSTT